MPFVEPYLDRAEAERQKVLQALTQLREEGVLYKGNALFIEGSSDQIILLGALQVMDIQLDAKIEVVEGLGGGANWVADRCIARVALADIAGKTVALLDDDDAGRRAAERIRTVGEALGRAGKVRCIFAGRDNGDDHVRVIKQSGMGISWALDEMCDLDDWRVAEEAGWLEPRTDELLKLNFQKLGGDMTLEQLIERRVVSPDHRRIVANSVKPERKMAFARAAAESMAMLGYVPPSLERLVKQLHEVFSPAR